jgi:hypothetical protein
MRFCYDLYAVVKRDNMEKNLCVKNSNNE